MTYANTNELMEDCRRRLDALSAVLGSKAAVLRAVPQAGGPSFSWTHKFWERFHENPLASQLDSLLRAIQSLEAAND